MATALFLLMEDGYPALSFRLDILTVVSATHVRSIQSPFMRNPFQGPELYGQILWTLTELLGIEVFDPRELSPTPQSELFLPIRAGAKQMTQAVDANNWIAQLQIDEPDYLKAPEDIEEALATDSSAPSRFFASLKDARLISNYEPWENEYGEEHSQEWRLYLGGPHILAMSAVREDDGTFTWSVAPWDWSFVFAEAPTPLEALMKAKLLIAAEDEDAWFDQILPKVEWLIKAEDLEPYALLDTPSPLAWPVDKLIPWAREMGLLETTGLWK